MDLQFLKCRFQIRILDPFCPIRDAFHVQHDAGLKRSSVSKEHMSKSPPFLGATLLEDESGLTLPWVQTPTVSFL